nr:transcription termination factor 1 [Nothobranchius furzeri]XP_054586286.1 transcription termination factor 1 [Nothobranchius furzeri]
MAAVEFSASSKKMKKKRELEGLVECSDPINSVTPVMVKKKKNKKQKNSEVEVEKVAEELSLHPDELMQSPSKKKKKISSEVEEELSLHPDELMQSPNKKKKKRSSGVEEVEEELSLHPDELMQSPNKKKKKRSSGVEEVEEELSLHPDELIKSQNKKKKKKRSSEVEEELSLHPDELMQSPNKKKKKRSSGVEEVEEELSLHPDELIKSHKKKKKRSSGVEEVEEELSLHPDGRIPNPNKKKRQDMECVAEVTPPDEKKKKPMTVTMATGSNHKAARKKKKKDVSLKPEEEKKRRKKTGKKRQGNDQDEDGEERINWILVDQLQEFIPDVKTQASDVIKRMLKYDLHRFQTFREQGVALRFGRYSKEENRKIVENVSDFLALTGISSATDLLFPQRLQEKGLEIKRLRAQHHFFESIADGIPRPCARVYTRARKMFDSRNYLGRYSENEMKDLRKFQKLHGNKWKVISELMGRSMLSLQKRFVTMDAETGQWTEDEMSRLKEAVKDYLESLVPRGSPSTALTLDQLCKNLPWKDISLKVQTRSWVQCRVKWFIFLKHRMTGNFSNRGPESFRAKICLINTLYNMDVDDPVDIDWDEVAQAVGRATPFSVQQMFTTLKRHRVPNWSRLSYADIIDYLKCHEVPYLTSKLKIWDERAELQVQQGENRYYVSDIFDEDCDS